MQNSFSTAIWFDDRFYKVPTGEIIASVTTKLSIEDKPFLLKYYAQLGWDQARRELNQAGDRGKRIHFALWCYHNKGAVVFNPYQAPNFSEQDIDKLKKETEGRLMIVQDQGEMLAVWKLQRFFEIVNPKIISTEQTVYSVEQGIAGTLDVAMLIEKGKYDVNGSQGLVIEKTGLYLGDYKTGNSISDSAWPQLSAYSKAYEENEKETVEGAIILHTSSTTKKGIEGLATSLKSREELEEPFQIFSNLSRVWNLRNPNAGPKAFTFPTLIKKEI